MVVPCLGVKKNLEYLPPPLDVHILIVSICMEEVIRIKMIKGIKYFVIISIFSDFSMSTGEKKQMRKDGNLPNEEKM